MKLKILHLSDLHVKINDKEWLDESANELISSSSVFSGLSDTLLICITGDLTHGGREDEFLLVKEWLSKIKAQLTNKFLSVEIVSIPGNHDCCFNGFEDADIRNLVIDKIDSLDDREITNKYIETCLVPLGNYFNFLGDTESGQAIIKNRILWSREFSVGDQRVIVNCINTSWASTIDESEKRYGKLVFPQIEKATLETGELNITLLHHPYNWFKYGNQQKLRKLLESGSDIILSGHEHHQKNSEVTSEGNLKNLVIASKQSKQKTICFSLISVDCENFEYQIHSHIDKKVLQSDMKGFVRINTKKRNKFTFTDEYFRYLNELPSSASHHKKDKLYLSDIYVTPRLRSTGGDSEEEYKVLDQKQYFEKFSEPGSYFIYGDQYAGKAPWPRT